MDEERPELDYHFYLGVLRRRWPIIALVCILTTGVALARSATSTRVYESSATVLVTDPQTSALDGGASSNAVDIPTEIQLFYSGPIQEAVNKKLGADAAKVSGLGVGEIGSTYLIGVAAQSSSPAVAQKAANAYAQQYVKIRTEQAIDAIQNQISIIQGKVDDIKSQMAPIQAQVNAAGLNPPASLTQQLSSLQTQLSSYADRLDRLSTDADLRANSGARVISEAGLPSTPIKPTPTRDALLGFALGLVLGLGLAFLTEFLDDKIKTTEDVARYGKGLQVIAEIPRIARERNGRRLVALDDPASGAAEAYRALRTSLRLIGLKQPIQTLLVTSPMASEGKTTLAANLGVTMARAGLRVIVVDLDLRRAQLAPMLGAPNDFGVMSVLLGEHTLAEVLYEVPISQGVPKLRLLPAGPLPPNPSEIMGTARMAELINSLKSAADVVILDTPPLVPVTDALVLSGRVDGVVLVASAGSTRRRHLTRATEYLEQADAPVIGAVLNNSGQHIRYGYYKKYDYSRRKRRGGRAVEESRQPVPVGQGNGNGSRSAPVAPGLESTPQP
jgi:capsular exopolysaccharide synthesis family protein